MTTLTDLQAQGLDACNCCAGETVQTPTEVFNRSGLSAIRRRVGTHATFLQSMQARLARVSGLTTRDEGDFTIALLDAWATTADVLTFYQERIANESFLRTATERRSLTALGELIGYGPRPGVAASSGLAFSLTETPGAPDQAPVPITIDIGTRVLSIPGPGSLPQTFETIEKIPARVEWNAMRPSLTKPQPVTADADSFLLNGLGTGIRVGDAIVVSPTGAGSTPVLRLVAEVATLPPTQQTRITLQPQTVTVFPPRPIVYIDYIPPLAIASDLGRLLEFQQQNLAQRVIFDGADVVAFGELAGFSPTNVFNTLRSWTPPSTAEVFVFRTRASLFGYNAPDVRSLSIDATNKYNSEIDTQSTQINWKVQLDSPNAQGQQDLDLDTVYSQIVATTPSSATWAAVKWLDRWVVGSADAIKEAGVAHYGLTGKATRLTLTPVGQSAEFVSLQFDNFSEYRGATVFAESEALSLARLPRDDEPVGPGNQIDLDDWIEGLYAGQRLIVSGELDQSRGNFASEMVQIKMVEQIIDSEGSTRLTLITGLQNAYVRSTVTINGNVALATHGETVQEVLGGGDASQRNLRLTLRQKPLTYIGDASANGAHSTLQLRVNTLLWNERPTLYGSGPTDRVYTTRSNDDGSTTVIFGDGINGARPPTGSENIQATYRKGIGHDGNVGAGQLTLMMVRPLGVSAVSNPVDAQGGTDPESADDIRQNAALTIRTLDRIVSLQDYEDFARAFGGIAKALATWSWHGEVRGVFLTVAGIDGAAVDSSGTLLGNLQSAIAASAEPNVPVLVGSYRKAFFTLSATLYIDSHYPMDSVLADAQQSLRTRYSFAARAFGQAVSLSDVVSFLQSVSGVVAVEVTSLRRTDSSADGRLAPLQAAGPGINRDGVLAGAELLRLDPRPVDLIGVTT